MEATYAAAVEAVCKERDTRLTELEQRHTRFILALGPVNLSYDREMTETVAAATGQDNPGAVSEHDVNALATHQVARTLV